MISQHLAVHTDTSVIVVEFCRHEAVQPGQAGMQAILATEIVPSLQSVGLGVEVEMSQSFAVEKWRQEGHIACSGCEEGEGISGIGIGVGGQVEVET